MIEQRRQTERAVREQLNCFFEKHPLPGFERKMVKALRILIASDESLAGNISGWAGGIIYAIANRHSIPCGIPNISNEEAENFFGVTMGTIRKRAARVNAVLDDLVHTF